MRHGMRRVLAGAAIGVLAAGPVSAQRLERVDRPGNGDVILLGNWGYDPLYTDGWSVEDVLDQTVVIDPTGAAIGDIENLVFSDDGTVLAIVAAIGGFWGIGDTHIRIPWDAVTLSDDATEVHVPVTEESIGDYSIFDEFRDEPLPEPGSGAQVIRPNSDLGRDAFRATDLIGDFASVEDNERYGYISDIVVREGAIAALVIEAAGVEPNGPRAYPYQGYLSWADPDSDARFRLPYTSAEADVIEDFDYDRLVRGGRG